MKAEKDPNYVSSHRAYKKLKDWLSEHSTLVQDQGGMERIIKSKKAPLFPSYDNYHLLIESNDNKGKFFAVPAEDWYGYVSNNIEDSFYISRNAITISSWNEGDNVVLMVPSSDAFDNAPFGNRSYLRYTWTVHNNVYDITNLVMDSDFSFLNWSDDNPWDVKE